jgi:hypothetical protein
VGLENELIGQSNFPLSRHREVPSRVADFLLFGGSSGHPEKSIQEIPPRTAASGPEYAVNGAL